MAEKSKTRADEIVVAATRLFAERGYDGVSVRDICAELSLNCSIVSYYFNGKKGLYLEVLRRQFRAYDLALAEAASAGREPREKLAALIGVMAEMRAEYPYFSAIMVRESSSPSQEYLQAASEYKNESLVDLIRDGQRLGQLKKGARADSLAVALSLLINGVAAAGALSSDPQAERDYFESVSLLLEGLTAVPGEGESSHRFGKQSARPRSNWSR